MRCLQELIRNLHTLGDGQPEGFEMRVRCIGVGDEFEMRDAEPAENLRAGAVFDHGGGYGLHGFVSVVLIGRSSEHLGECIANAVGAKIDDRTTPGVLDHLHRFGEHLSRRVVTRGTVVAACG